MTELDFLINDEHGIHARPATELFKISKNFESIVKASKDGKEVAFKGVMGLMSLGAKKGDTIHFSFYGPDEETECAAFKTFLEENL